MTDDPHITQFNIKRCDKNRNAIIINVWKESVFDHITLEQHAHWRVAAKDEGSVELKESSYHMLIQMILQIDCDETNSVYH